MEPVSTAAECDWEQGRACFHTIEAASPNSNQTYESSMTSAELAAVRRQCNIQLVNAGLMKHVGPDERAQKSAAVFHESGELGPSCDCFVRSLVDQEQASHGQCGTVSKDHGLELLWQLM